MPPPTLSSLLRATKHAQLRKSVPAHTRISTIREDPSLLSHSATLQRTRHVATSSGRGYPRKDSQDRESMNTEATEYSRSATDDQAARQEDPAFDPSVTDPDSQRHRAAEESKGQSNPLEVSPANPDVSPEKPRTRDGTEKSIPDSNTTGDRQRTSGGGSPAKGRRVA